MYRLYRRYTGMKQICIICFMYIHIISKPMASWLTFKVGGLSRRFLVGILHLVYIKLFMI